MTMNQTYSEEGQSEKWNQVNQRCYDLQADNWDRFPFADFLPLFIQHYHDPRLGNTVLDIGSGTGVLAKWLQDQGFEPFCIDPSDEMVRRCRKKGLTVQQTTIQDFHSNETFGMVMAILSLIHVPKNEFSEQITKIATLLPQKGIFLLALIEGNSEGIQEVSSGYPRYFSTFAKDDVLNMTKGQSDLLDYRSVGKNPTYLVFVLQKR